MDNHLVHGMPNYDFLSGNGYPLKQLFQRNSDRDSSSTNKSEQSHQEASAVSDSSLSGQHTSTRSDNNNNDGCEKRDQGMIKSSMSFGNPEAAFSPPTFDYSQPFACVPYPYATDPYYGGILTGYTSHAIVYPQTADNANSRVPLPVEPLAEEPIFVNAKQYHAILRRRQMRAKLEAQDRMVKGRKPYLHESRHLHAMKRARGSGGRFLNRKELQEQQAPLPSIQAPSGRSMALGKKNMCPENSTSCSPSTPTGSEISSISFGGGMLNHKEHMSFSPAEFPPTMNQHHRVPIMR